MDYSHENELQAKKCVRRPNFTTEEIDALLSGYKRRKHIFLPKLSAVLTAAMKRENWMTLCCEVNATSVNNRTVEEIKRKMKDLKQALKHKATGYQKPSGTTNGKIMEEAVLSPTTLEIVGILSENLISSVVGGIETCISSTKEIPDATTVESMFASQAISVQDSLHEIPLDINVQEMNNCVNSQPISAVVQPTHNTQKPALTVVKKLKDLEAVRINILKGMASDLKRLVNIQQGMATSIRRLVNIQQATYELKKMKYASQQAQQQYQEYSEEMECNNIPNDQSNGLDQTEHQTEYEFVHTIKEEIEVGEEIDDIENGLDQTEHETEYEFVHTIKEEIEDRDEIDDIGNDTVQETNSGSDPLFTINDSTDLIKPKLEVMSESEDD